MFAWFARIEQKLDCILTHLSILFMEIDNMSPELQVLSERVAANTAVTASAITLIHGLADQIAAAKDDPVAIAALAAELAKSSADLAAAVAENTPAAPPAPAP